MTSVISIKFKENGKPYFFNPCGYLIKKDDYVIVETARGIECGIATAEVISVADEKITKPLKNVVRVATKQDMQKLKEIADKQKEAFSICEQKILDHKLDMKLVDIEITFDNSKILFYFTADGRVDFRDLVKDLAVVFKKRIELRQIGVRDECKMKGGLGICGREFCCKGFLNEFAPVSIKMAKEQNLSLNPTKISGSCGRLMCCLKYEQEAYEELVKISPRVGNTVQTPEGRGRVLEVALLTGNVKVSLDGDEVLIKSFNRRDIKVIGDQRNKQNHKDNAKSKSSDNR